MEDNSIKKVNKHSRAGANGKKIYCPVCDAMSLVYHFSWDAMTCSGCRKMIDKYDWNLESGRNFKIKKILKI